MSEWRKFRLLRGWKHGALPLMWQLTHDGAAVDLRGAAVRQEKNPTDEDIARPIARVPRELDGFRGLRIQKFTRFHAFEEDRPVTILIDDAGFLRCIPHDRRRKEKS